MVAYLLLRRGGRRRGGLLPAFRRRLPVGQYVQQRRLHDASRQRRLRPLGRLFGDVRRRDRDAELHEPQTRRFRLELLRLRRRVPRVQSDRMRQRRVHRVGRLLGDVRRRDRDAELHEPHRDGDRLGLQQLGRCVARMQSTSLRDWHWRAKCGTDHNRGDC